MLMHVQRSGPLLAWRNPQNPEGRKPHAISQKGEFFVLTPWISGREPSPLSLTDMRACGIALARFHKAGQNALKGDISHSQIGMWYSTLHSRQQYIQKRLQKQKQIALVCLLVDLSNGMDQRFCVMQTKRKHCCEAADMSLTDKVPEKWSLVSWGWGPSNFILNENGTYLIDFETLHVDLRAYDLYRVIYNSCKDYRWDFSIAKAILDGYREVAKLKKLIINLFVSGCVFRLRLI